MPGMETNIGLQTTKIVRLEKPFKSNCTSIYLDEEMKGLLSSEMAYSSKTCKGTCYVKHFWKSCQCIHSVLMEGLEIENWFGKLTEKVRACNTTVGSKDMVCMYNTVNANSEQDGYVCSCNPECIEGGYKVSSDRKLINSI